MVIFFKRCNSCIKLWRKNRKKFTRNIKNQASLNKYSWKRINYLSGKEKWKKFDKNNPTIYLMLKSDIYPIVFSSHNWNHENTHSHFSQGLQHVPFLTCVPSAPHRPKALRPLWMSACIPWEEYGSEKILCTRHNPPFPVFVRADSDYRPRFSRVFSDPWNWVFHRPPMRSRSPDEHVHESMDPDFASALSLNRRKFYPPYLRAIYRPKPICSPPKPRASNTSIHTCGTNRDTTPSTIKQMPRNGIVRTLLAPPVMVPTP